MMPSTPFRLRLTASSILKILTMVVLICSVSYAGVISYISTNRDQALRERMALEFKTLGLPVPPELPLPNSTSGAIQGQQLIEQFEDPTESYDSPNDDAYGDDEDDAGFVSSPGSQAQPIQNLLGSSIPGANTGLLDEAAVKAAGRNGFDLREIFTSNGVHMRLLTYRLPPSAPVAYLQVGKLLASRTAPNTACC